MFDQKLRGYTDPILKNVTGALNDANISPNQLTFIGIVFGFTCFVALFLKLYFVALFFMGLNRLCDGIDGVLARELDEQGKNGSSDFGGYLDIVSDFIFYNGFVFFFALGAPENILAAAFLLFSFVGTGTTFLAYAIFESKHNRRFEKLEPQNTLQKSFYYIGGLTEGTETILCFTLMCIFPASFVLFACVFGMLCWFTTATRMIQAFQTLR